MLCAIDSIGESGGKQVLFPWKLCQDSAAKTVARSNP